MGTEPVAMHWGRRLLFLAVGALFTLLLGLALSVALARPAGAATLPPLPTTPTFPVSVPVPGVSTLTGLVPGVEGTTTSLPAGVVAGATAAGSSLVALTAAPVPTLPLGPLPLPTLPVITLPGIGTLYRGPAGVPPATGAVPGTGGPAHGSARSGSSTARHLSAGGAAANHLRSASGPLSPAPAPGHRSPSPSFPLPNAAALVPGHGNSPGNVIPLTLGLLAALVIAGVFLRRRLPLKLLFDSRFAPPG